jgi:hypothetical protein
MPAASREHRARAHAWVGAWVLALVAACSVASTRPSQAPPSEPPPAPPVVAAPPAPAILSAHVARLDDLELGGKDGVVVVFDTEVDAAALQARAFVVTYLDGEPVTAERAILAPASEDDENRTVLLVGELAAVGAEPSHVVVVEPLWAEDGRSLEGLSAPVVPFAAGPRAVAAEVLASGPGRCEGAARMVRTYWSDELRGVEAEDLARVRVSTGEGEGAAANPVRFDDHAIEHGESGEDNVLDLCLVDAALPRRVWIDAGTFRGPAGHESAAVDVVVTLARASASAPAPASAPS